MHRILVVDDQEQNRRLLQDLLGIHGYAIELAEHGAAALQALRAQSIDLVLLDVVMPVLDGFATLKSIREDEALRHIPVVLCTALDPERERVRGLEAGADDFLQKPINHAELLARVRSLLRAKSLFDALSEREAQLRELNTNLEQRVAEKTSEVLNLSRLKRFFSARLAERILAGGVNDPLQSHRKDIAVVFTDLRGFTAFSDAAAPEDVMRVLREFHAALGGCIDASGGTIERFTGDGAMVFFNDPEPLTNPCKSAIEFALNVRTAVRSLSAHWRSEGFHLHVGIGVSYGYATIGSIGYAGRVDYGAIGTVTNLAARLCDAAAEDEILVQQRVLVLSEASEPRSVSHELRTLELRGFRQPVQVALLS